MKKYLAALLIGIMVTVGCAGPAWVSTVNTILVAAAPALINILQIVAIANGVPVNGSLVAKINTDATAIKTLASDFSKASAVSAPTVCGQLQGAIGAYQADEILVMQVAQVSDQNTQIKIGVLSELVAGTVQGILTAVPACAGPPAAPVKMSVASALKLSNFISTYNSVLVTPTGNSAVDALTHKLVIHQHSKGVRVVSFGHLN
jgi:hypothetical protein